MGDGCGCMPEELMLRSDPKSSSGTLNAAMGNMTMSDPVDARQRQDVMRNNRVVDDFIWNGIDRISRSTHGFVRLMTACLIGFENAER